MRQELGLQVRNKRKEVYLFSIQPLRFKATFLNHKECTLKGPQRARDFSVSARQVFSSGRHPGSPRLLLMCDMGPGAF